MRWSFVRTWRRRPARSDGFADRGGTRPISVPDVIRIQFGGFSVVPTYPTTGGTLSILWIILIVILVLALLGFFGRGRF